MQQPTYAAFVEKKLADECRDGCDFWGELLGAYPLAVLCLRFRLGFLRLTGRFEDRVLGVFTFIRKGRKTMRIRRTARMLATVTFAIVSCSAGERLPGQSDEEIDNSIGMQLKRVTAGTFLMGSVRGNPDADLDEEQHMVTITKDFFLGAYEVTQAQYEQVMGNNPSQFQRGEDGLQASDYPVEQVSWDDAVVFCEKLSELPEEQQAGRTYRLPTEAEWEMACRAGTQTAFSFGNEVRKLADHAWYEANSEGRTHKVGVKKPNPFGLYDMHGNVWEWVADWYIRHQG